MPKKIFSLVPMAILTALALGLQPAVATQLAPNGFSSTSPSENQNSYVINASSDAISFERLHALASSLHAQVREVESIFEIGDSTYKIGLEAPSLKSKWVAIEEIKLALASLDAPGNSKIAEQVQQYENRLRNGAVTFRQVTLVGGQSILSNLARNTLRRYGLSTPTISTPSETRTKGQAISACGDWTPHFINSLSGEHAISGRTERITFDWTASSLSSLRCTNSTTFEPDFVTYNYDRKHYLGLSVLSWSSNLPDAYSDTNLFDSADELVTTIGTPSVSKLKSNFTYSNYVHADSGNATGDTAKIVWQRGHQNLGCPPLPVTLCVFTDQSVKYDAWNITLPGSYPN